MKKYVCDPCGYVYDPQLGDPDNGIAPGTAFKDLPEGQGLNSANGEWGDMIEMGVLDPVKVTRTTLQNAASVAGLILITEATVTDEPKDTTIEEAISAAAAAGGQGGGMY